MRTSWTFRAGAASRVSRPVNGAPTQSGDGSSQTDAGEPFGRGVGFGIEGELGDPDDAGAEERRRLVDPDRHDEDRIEARTRRR